MEEEGIDSHILRLADFEKLIFVNISRIDGYFDFADAEELAGLKEAIRKFYYRFGVLIGLSNSSDAEKVKWFRMAQNFLSDSIELHNRILKGRFDFPGYEKQYGIDAEYILGMEEPSPENILQLLSATRVYLTYRARYILMNNKDLFLSGYKSPRDLSLAQKKFWKSLIEDLREEFS